MFRVLLAVTLSFSPLVFAASDKPELLKDFDHNVHYQLEQLDDKNYHLTVARLGKARFGKMNLFATRKARKICGKMGYSITYLDGVEGFDDRKGMPNYIFPSLKVKITCP